MPQPKLSVIIPVYNTEKYLRECLDSVLAQTLQDIEIIVINDASPDSSQSIIDEYAAKDTRIQCIVHPENLGQGEARNRGIAAAQGDYITFVDSDDWVDRHCYGTVIEKMEAAGANLGVFSVEKFDEKNGSRQFVQSYYLPYGSAQKITAQKINCITNTMWNKIFYSEDIQQEILRLPIHLKHEDEEFWFKYVSWIKPLAIGIPRISGTLYHYRQHNDSIMANTGISYKDYPKILYNIRHYLETEHLYFEYHSIFESKILQSLDCYKELFVEYREQYCYDMRHLFEQCHLGMAELLALDSRLSVYYIEDELLRQHFLNSQQDCEKLQQDHKKFQQDHEKLQKDHEKLQQGHEKIQQDHEKFEQDRWYRFGQLSRKRKLWVIARVLSKRLGLYRILRPLGKITKDKKCHYR